MLHGFVVIRRATVSLILLLVLLTILGTQTIHTQALLTTQPPNTTLWESEDLGTGVLSVAWSPGGDKIAVCAGSDGVVVLDAGNGSILWESQDLGGDVYSVAWSPDGDKIAAGGDFRKVIVLDVGTGTVLWQKDLGGDVESVAWSPDGDKIAAGTRSNRVIVFDVSFGVFRISGLPGTVIVVQGTGGTGNYTIPSQQTLTLYASPGNYTITYTLPKPQNYIGDPDFLRGSFSISMVVERVSVIEVPGYNELLSVLSVSSSGLNVNVTVYWSGGRLNFVLGSGENKSLYLAPGEYEVVAYRDSMLGLDLYKPVVLNVSAEAGGVYSVVLDPGMFHYSTAFYGLMGAIGIILLLVGFGVFQVVKGRLVVESVEGELVRGVGGSLRVKVRNPGLWRWKGDLVVIVDGREVYVKDVSLGKREAGTLGVYVGWEELYGKAK
ncbi:MAG: PQQ-binding-like beta-propeller repeat protein [Desulfurococcales archaeon]|nr:PQQ-binding-like beta-propeller repeat protein [Desulfurococcales archaeon]